MEVLRLENVSKYYTSKSGVVMGLSSINLSFKVGEFVAITGESGSGKSIFSEESYLMNRERCIYTEHLHPITAHRTGSITVEIM